ncbi:hypothetical protein [Novosphingobium sp. Gsoil 351]|uniref:hypothetical protein n=1 Tax=Novosphingobium sp. Gsoil 351 TaxID=2675225 RepID=UPI0012B4B84A|nr:hypothetical protein [Novosphingobium sp. Gsoil 351]QGN54756.1 hypothetical protein GKE62_09515 [Novosphingobium sp. Gsoil 351]
MTTTRYFDEQVLRKRPYLTIDLCLGVIAKPVRTEIRDDGRVRHLGTVTLPNEDRPRILRVVTLEDRTTIHNAFVDRTFREDAP